MVKLKHGDEMKQIERNSGRKVLTDAKQDGMGWDGMVSEVNRNQESVT